MKGAQVEHTVKIARVNASVKMRPTAILSPVTAAADPAGLVTTALRIALQGRGA